MSLTGVSPLITSWIEKGLEWRYFWRPVERPFTIAAKAHIQVPSEGYTFSAPEGVLLTFGAMFDDPSCGIRLESNPELDTAEVFTVSNMNLIGFYNTPMYVTAMVPPRIAPGQYGIAQQKEWPFEEWMRLYVFNSDSRAHRCLAYGYTVALLREPRKNDAGKVS